MSAEEILEEGLSLANQGIRASLQSRPMGLIAPVSRVRIDLRNLGGLIPYGSANFSLQSLLISHIERSVEVGHRTVGSLLIRRFGPRVLYRRQSATLLQAASVLLHFVEMPIENLYFSRQAPPL